MIYIKAKDKGIAPPFTLNELVYIPRTLNSTWLFDLYLQQTLLFAFLYTTHHVLFLLAYLSCITFYLIIYITYESSLFSLLIQKQKNKAGYNDMIMINKIITAINQNGILLLLYYAFLLACIAARIAFLPVDFFFLYSSTFDAANAEAFLASISPSSFVISVKMSSRVKFGVLVKT